MKYKSDDLYNYEQKSWWILEIFKNIRHIEDKPRNFYRNEWFEFHPLKWGVCTTLDEAGYFDERPQLNFHVSQLIGVILIPVLLLNFSWWMFLITFTTLIVGIGEIYLHLPFHSGILDCGDNSRQWGFYIYYYGFLSETQLVICKGKKSKYISFPWNLEWYRTSYQTNTGTTVWDNKTSITHWLWEHEFKGKRKDFYDEKWNGVLWEQTYPYIYILNSGEVQNRLATIKVVEREWRRRWLPFTSLFNQVIRSIDVTFDKEVGERTGSWKGGTVGCGWDLKPNETPYQCLKRMEQERKFN